MDDIDIAQEQEALFTSSAIALARKRKPPEHTGACLNCDADLPSMTMRFCDRECSLDWEHRSSTRAKQGLQ